MSLVKSRQRVIDHGEVFTPGWMVEKMLDLVKSETERIDSRFLDPACGNGNFLVQVLKRKLDAVKIKHGQSGADKQHYALLALMCIYGIELLPDNIAECRGNLLKILSDHLNLDESDDLYLAARQVLELNLIHGDALRMRVIGSDSPIIFPEWSYQDEGKFKRKDFRLNISVYEADCRNEAPLFPSEDEQGCFIPESETVMTINMLAANINHSNE